MSNPLLLYFFLIQSHLCMRERKKKKKNISLAASGEILEFSNFASKIWSLNDVSQI